MADNNVQYTLSLKDLMTSKIKEANVAATALESTMSILGVAAGAFAGIEFLKGSVEAFNESEQASAQLDATLKSTANAANLNREALDEQALSLMNTSLFDDDAITHTQGLLATFTNIKDTIYMDAVPAIADLATKLGGDLQGATIQVGKALNDPIHGITALSRAGVSFSESQKKVIENLQKTGDIAGAQRIILAELNREFAGSALASATTGTGAYTVLQHQMGNVKEEIGGIVVAIGNELLPMFVSMVEGIHDVVQGLKDGWKWIKENRVVFESLAVGIGVAAGALLVYSTYQKTSLILTELLTLWTNREAIATNAMTAAQWLLNAAMAANPIGLVITAIATLAAGFYYLYQKSEPFRQSITMLKDDAMIAGYALKWMYDKARGDAEAATQDMAKMNELLAERKSIIDGTYNAHKGELVTGGKPFSMLLDKNEKKAIKGEKGMDGVTEKKPDKAKGSQSITINISINKLIESFKVETTNIQESTAKIQEMVANTLLAAVNDASITANI
jgi:hypothetical protein